MLTAIDVPQAIKEKIEDFFKDNFAVGNSREASLETFELDGSEFHFKVHCRSRQTNSVINYSVSYDLEATYDFLSPADGELSVTININHIGRKRFSASIREIVSLFSEIPH
ncbi:hypothetical protein [Clostridium beijerinckii]|uniref:Uncharacterized protein n=1 Tax=Clostridium beijerinckii TaxID=1520 RepID=A0A9Q5GK30_CLOBE|nr:hypothetical protein [Clostridium beijerinckii]AQS04767.1 hypothetical protein CLBIJ_21970 [Clostridium beijerinckii]MBA2887556.1 hypothetical protein [Clostridium beijerinckii]MBA2902446.1 hypothetical protein [Clostridium beijerinckii]MBA2912264.1 hypothetical protein [Clostridium beijerinckii]MBA9015674.1 hypothetical protein [Clostridium beijerinckii]